MYECLCACRRVHLCIFSLSHMSFMILLVSILNIQPPFSLKNHIFNLSRFFSSNAISMLSCYCTRNRSWRQSKPCIFCVGSRSCLCSYFMWKSAYKGVKFMNVIFIFDFINLLQLRHLLYLTSHFFFAFSVVALVC